MAEKKRGLTDQAIMVKVDQAAKESVGWYDSRLSRERQRVINFYNSTLPRRQSDGNSSYVSSDVYDSTEQMKAQIVETFSANPDNLVSFPPLGNKPNDIEAARVATEYCNHVVFVENDGEGMVYDATHDGLTARAGVAKVFWESREERTEETFSGISYQDVQGLASQPDVDDLHADAGPDGTFSGTLVRTEDTSGVQIEVLPPEEFLIKPRARSIVKSDFCAHRTLKTKADLIAMGYDKTKVADIHYDDDKGLDLSPEVLARESQVESAQALNNAWQDELEQVMLYESYIKLDRYDGKGVRLYKVCHAGAVLLAIDEVDRAPFKAFIPLPIPHMFLGNNFAARVIPTQNARTVLTRGILDHTAATTNPRYTVLKGGLLNPKEMLDNRLRGIVNINRPDAVKPLEQAQLNPFTFKTIEMLKANKEESTGISALSQGLNKDAISTQNSAALVDNLVTLSTQRQKIVARNFAKFLAEVYLEVYRLVLENQDKEKDKIVKVAGNFIPIATKDWVERLTCKVALHLGYGERDRMVVKYEGLYKSLSSDPAVGPMFTPTNRYQLITDGMKAAGFERWATYITPPEQITPPQPDPEKMAEVQAKATTAGAAMINAKANLAKVTMESQMAQFREQLSELNAHVKSMLGAHAEARKDAEVKNRIQISNREMALAESAAASGAVKETDVVAPHG